MTLSPCASAAAMAGAMCAAALIAPTSANAQLGGAPGGPSAPGCAISGSSSVFVEGRSMLRLGDVQGCPGLRYEVIPNVFINGQPAVRLLPKPECGGSAGAQSVAVDGKQAGRQGDGC